MRNTVLVVAVFALPLILAAFAAGWTLSGLGQARPEPPHEPVSSATPDEGTVPPAVAGEDVPGDDLAGLPRYPGSTRVAYRQGEFDGLARTRAEYASDDNPDYIRAFYRRVFHSGGWTVADLSFSPEEWYFFVVKDEREALVEIHALRRPVIVEIELTGPAAEPPADVPVPPSAPAVPVPQPEEDDEGEGDDEYYEGGDD